MPLRPKTHPPRRDTARPACGRAEAAYQRLKRAIIEGIYTPRQRLVEADIAPALGVSRATLRAVLIRLHHEGLIEIQPNRGAQVRAFGVEEAVQIFQVREALEGLAAALAAEQVTPAQLAELHRIVTAMEKTLAAADLLGQLPLAGRFHQTIIEAAHNAFIEQFLSTLHAPLVRHQFRIILVPGRKEASLAEHRAILSALEQHDAAQAEQAMRQHLVQLRRSLQHASRLPMS
jgi:DNA-binding GntR family transcriptional regulator